MTSGACPPVTSTVATVTTLNALPQSLNYLYPATDDYYYRYGDGYLYQIDPATQLISQVVSAILR